MIICDKKICTGCAACYSICPVNCISMEYDEDGFLVPIVDDENCIKCNKCKEICPSLNKVPYKNYKSPITIGCWHKNKETLKKSSSGGAFSAMAEYTFKNNGVVIGCSMGEDLTPYHTIAYDYEDLKPIHGSKYLQSEIKDMYIETKKLLDMGVDVLFSGCPCQIAGLYAYLKNDVYTNLITVDLVCHGVGSKKIFDNYIQEMNEKFGDSIKEISFRSKEKNGRNYVTKLSFSNSSPKYVSALRDPYMSCYLQRAIYRDSCYQCKYADLPRVADFTVGDFIGINRKEISKKDYRNGVSVILLNNKKAEEKFEDFKQYLNWMERPLKEATSTNSNIYKSSVMPSYREEIFNSFDSVTTVKNKYCNFKLRVHIANIIGEDNMLLVKGLLRKIRFKQN
ncbi:Coenzyme F420 hydrogenase/dehydrogenase, beta subunit C-terminal domain [Brassicibacter mesophilus]|uniref:Coenzyme F420 hydrogenase/dehydrogenase, beta subunit C-terminal domain n=1 Tax=Brassicibacter mesophilus TaxID=745119 RepID=UPI003D22146B